MSISFYDASVGSFRQIVGAVGVILDKGLAHCREHGTDPETLADSAIAPDMLNFRRQIHFVAHFSIGTIEGLQRGSFEPPNDVPHMDYPALQALIGATQEKLRALDRAEVEALAERDISFRRRGVEVAFNAPGFVLSFALPNLNFHATTAYDLLRAKGVKLVKRDYLGAMRLKV